MHNLVIFCKSFRGDLNRIKILKKSIDRFNADKLPFYIVCPQDDISLFQRELVNGKENYELRLISDEDVLEANGIGKQKQNWYTQQIIKLGFYKLGLCNHYAIFDSDCYFIQNFYFSDFMYDDDTPYFYLKEILSPTEEEDFVRRYLKRKGRTYGYIYNSQIFSRIILQDMEQQLLQKNKLKLTDLISMHRYEFNWYGEWFIYSGIIPLNYTRGKLKVFWSERQYQESRKNGDTEQDFVKAGYNAILMQNRWVKDKKYKPSSFSKLIKAQHYCLDKFYEPRENKSILKKVELIFRIFIRDGILFLLRKK